MIIDGKLFVSVSSLESKFASDYECADSPLQNRFCEVGGSGRETYSIDAPVCLYKQEELVSMLESTSWSIDKIYKSAFGNIKAISSKA